MNIFEALRESHETQRTLCTSLVRCKPAERTAVFAELRRELEAHAAAEERFLYAVVLMDDAGLSSARHALSEHHEMEEQLEELSVNNKKTVAWMRKATKLTKEVRHHLKEEETKFFQVAGRILSNTAKAKLGTQYTKDFARMLRVV
jgi:hemerythrin superfamily protein